MQDQYKLCLSDNKKKQLKIWPFKEASTHTKILDVVNHDDFYIKTFLILYYYLMKFKRNNFWF